MKPQTVYLDDKAQALVIIDQTKLPAEHVYLTLTTAKEVYDAIARLCVRGAPAIGDAAAIGLYAVACHIPSHNKETFIKEILNAKALIASSRPTAVNLFWALDRMEAVLFACRNLSVIEIKKKLRQEACNILEEDKLCCKKIGEHGLSVLKPGMGILTHCNAGALATAQYGTATAPIYLGQEQGYAFRVFADETRPLLQGARLTAYELMEHGVDVTLICDNMAATVMRQGLIDAVLVGCDRVAANGDTANKIGTLNVAILAKHFDIPFYVCAPYSTIDKHCSTGEEIEIEERNGEEITSLWYQKPMAPSGVKTYNPAFDVTPHTLITAFITEKGVVNPPFHK